MRLRARSLHVLASAPVAAIAAASLGMTTHAQAAASPAPQPLVVAIDAGHGGSPNLSDPTQPFDPGAIGPNGMMEKVVTLDVAQRVAALLREDLVAPLLTRTGDTWVTIADREQAGIDAHAVLFVSIHCNSYTAPDTTGSLVLYPNAQSQAFAQTLEDALGRDLASSRVPDDGIVLRDNWWIHNPMPTGTVEMAYLSNPREAALMATEDFRQQVAIAIRDGIERYDPQIAQRKAQILAWEQAHPGAPPPTPAVTITRPVRVTAAAHTGSAFGTVLVWMVLLGAAVAAVRWRRPLARVLVPAAEMGARLAADGIDHASEVLRTTSFHRAAARRRRRRLRLNSLSALSSRGWAPYSVYDELSF